MPFHVPMMASLGKVDYMSVLTQMGIAFVFWYVLGYFTGGSRWAAATLGAVVAGIAVAITPQTGQIPNLGVVTQKSTGPGWNFAGTAMASGITFVTWLVVGYFFIKGSAWKYATTAAIIAAVISFVGV